MALNDWKHDAMQYRDIDRAVMEKVAPWRVSLNKSRSTWNWFTSNPHGGGCGSNYCGPQYIAMRRATANIPIGAHYELTINGKQKGMFTIEGHEHGANCPIPCPIVQGRRI